MLMELSQAGDAQHEQTAGVGGVGVGGGGGGERCDGGGGGDTRWGGSGSGPSGGSGFGPSGGVRGGVDGGADASSAGPFRDWLRNILTANGVAPLTAPPDALPGSVAPALNQRRNVADASACYWWALSLCHLLGAEPQVNHMPRCFLP